MSKKVVVKDDKVEGTDTHNVAGMATNTAAPPPTIPYKGTARFDYVGRMTGGLSDFVRIDGKPVATVKSRSSLDPGQTAPGGKHTGASGSGFTPASPAPILDALMKITDKVGEGAPSSGAGSAFVKVGGQKLLLNGDPVDTCSGTGEKENSRVTSGGQKFVSCSA